MQTANYDGPDFGMNLGLPKYWVRDYIFTDFMKSAGDFGLKALDRIVGIPAGAAEAFADSMDADGYAREIPAGTFIQRSVAMLTEPTEYEVSWKGRGTIKFAFNTKVLESRDGFMRIMSWPANGSHNQMTIRDMEKGNHVRDLSMVPTAEVAEWKAGRVIRQPYIDRFDGFPELRFMNWQATNWFGGKISPVKTVADLPRMTAASWGKGVPLEVCRMMAQAIGAEEWYCIPALAEPELIDFFADWVGDRGHLEPSNEVWNTGFPQGQWALKQGGGTPAGHPVFVGTWMGNMSKRLAARGAKLSVGWRPSDGPKTWDAFMAALLATGAKEAGGISQVMTTGYNDGGLGTVALMTPYMERGDRAGVIARMVATTPRNLAVYQNAKRWGDHLGVPTVAYEAYGHLRTSAFVDTCAEFVDSVMHDPAIMDFHLANFAAAKEAGIARIVLFEGSAAKATGNGSFGIFDTPLEAYLDEWRAKRRTPPTIEEQMAAMRADIAALQAAVFKG